LLSKKKNEENATRGHPRMSPLSMRKGDIAISAKSLIRELMYTVPITLEEGLE
jgi:hypothetical protein